MASREKTFYFLKLEKDFFDKKEIKLLRKIAGGDTYTIIYLKMLLMALADDGVFYFESIGDNIAEEVALQIDEEPENVAVTLGFLQKKGLLEIVETDKYYLNSTPEMVGQITSNALRQRRFQAKKKMLALENNAPLTQDNVEIEKELDSESESRLRNRDIDLRNIEASEKNNAEPSPDGQSPSMELPSWLNQASIEELKKTNPKNYHLYIPIQYLNQKTGHVYKFIPTHTKFIQARYKDGYTLEDFKKVIDTKVAQWKNDSHMAKFLRPKTLFSPSNFDSYLNEAPKLIQVEQDNMDPLPF
ncbi:conserved phage C-terminal domain-containing protein [Streptococcus suis]|uniref:conserved phage C-terminal domain-containing protein n=1 Tax=Streptococcus suis TaxID=1307 RepID=UPI00289375AD|nr:conserved phage C-terminal domain-containing protein [Streptococcus suis]WNF68788.1 conserved phage C-terminal domain-containing protein [Streptococcus suis]WNF70249.1 conserved phage C-terminal domain-containing protein [Streptococcus suis]WNF70575.1 conserved phage C-terminal domain-containing protein [Streptococcus suis]